MKNKNSKDLLVAPSSDIFDVIEAMKNAPALDREEREAFARDLEEIRKRENRAVRDPWADEYGHENPYNSDVSIRTT